MLLLVIALYFVPKRIVNIAKNLLGFKISRGVQNFVLEPSSQPLEKTIFDMNIFQT